MDFQLTETTIVFLLTRVLLSFLAKKRICRTANKITQSIRMTVCPYAGKKLPNGNNTFMEISTV
jgi:hypothetical protein